MNSETEIISQIGNKEPKKGEHAGFLYKRNGIIRKEKPPRSMYAFETGGHARPRAPSRSVSEAGNDFPLFFFLRVLREIWIRNPRQFLCYGDFQSDKGQSTWHISGFFCSKYKTL